MTTSNRARDFALHFGNRWLSQAIALASPDARRLVRSLDPATLTTWLDVTVRGKNVTADLPPEPLGESLESWRNALVALRQGSSCVEIEQTQSPLVVALERRAETVLVSVYELGAPGCVRCERVDVSVQQFSEAVTTSARDVERDARTLACGLGESVARRARALEEAALALSGSTTAGGAITQSSVPLQVHTEGQRGVALTLRLHPESTGLDRAEGGDVPPRFPLLAHGDLALSTRHEATIQLAGRPLRVLEAMVDGLIELLLRRGKPGEPTEVRAVLTRLEHGALEARLRGDESVVLARTGAARVQTFIVPLDELLRVVSEHVGAVRSALGSVNPVLSGNALLRELGRRASLLGRAAAEPSGYTSPTHHRPHGEGGNRVTQEPVAFGVPVPTIRRLWFERTWTAPVPATTGSGIRCLGHGLVAISSEKSVTVLSSASGEEVCRYDATDEGRIFVSDGAIYRLGSRAVERLAVPTHAAAIGAWRSGGGGWSPQAVEGANGWALVLAGNDGHVRAFRADSGASLWTSDQLEMAPVGVQVADDAVVVAGAGELLALDLVSGRLRWRVELPWGRVSFRAVGGDVVVVADEPIASRAFIGVVSGKTGNWSRRSEHAADVLAVSWTAGHGVSVVVGASGDATVLRIDAREGSGWETSLPGPLDASNVRCVDVGGMIVVGDGRCVRGVSGEEVRWAIRAPTHVVRVVGEPDVAYLSAEDALLVVDARTGRVIDRVAAFWEALSALVVHESGAVTLLESVAPMSARAHGLALIGMIAALEGGRATG